MKEQKVLVKCIYDTGSASAFQEHLQGLLAEGWQITRTEHSAEAFMVVLEREKHDINAPKYDATIEQVEQAYKNGYALGSRNAGSMCINILKKQAYLETPSTCITLSKIVDKIEKLLREETLKNG